MTDKTSRDKCYFARDTYFACLDKHGIISSRQPSVDALMKSSMNPFAARDPKLPPLEPEVDKNAQLPAECKPFRVAFESSCLGSWVSHFEKLREREAVKKALEAKGYQPLPTQQR